MTRTAAPEINGASGGSGDPAYAGAGVAGVVWRIAALRLASVLSPNATARPARTRMTAATGRYQNQAIAMTSGASTAVAINETSEAPAPSTVPISGTTSATTTSGFRIIRNPKYMTSAPTPRIIQVSTVFSLSAALNISAADIVPGRTINSRSPALV